MTEPINLTQLRDWAASEPDGAAYADAILNAPVVLLHDTPWKVTSSIDAIAKAIDSLPPGTYALVPVETEGPAPNTPPKPPPNTDNHTG